MNGLLGRLVAMSFSALDARSSVPVAPLAYQGCVLPNTSSATAVSAPTILAEFGSSVCNINCGPPYPAQYCADVGVDDLDTFNGYYSNNDNNGQSLVPLSVSTRHRNTTVTTAGLRPIQYCSDDPRYVISSLTTTTGIQTEALSNSITTPQALIATITSMVPNPESTKDAVVVPLTWAIPTRTGMSRYPTPIALYLYSSPEANGHRSFSGFPSPRVALLSNISKSYLTTSNLLSQENPIIKAPGTWPTQFNSRFTKVAVSGPNVEQTRASANDTVWVTIKITDIRYVIVGASTGGNINHGVTKRYTSSTSTASVESLDIVARTLMSRVRPMFREVDTESFGSVELV